MEYSPEGVFRRVKLTSSSNTVILWKEEPTRTLAIKYRH
jgi:hypothetical protein